MFLAVLLLGLFLPNSFGISFETDAILQSIFNEINSLKKANSVCAERLTEIDELKYQINELQELNRDLQIKVKELYQERYTEKQVSDNVKDLIKKTTKRSASSKRQSNSKSSSVDKSLHTETLRILKRQIPADGRVAFTAALSAGIPNLGPHQTVIFDNAVTNIGNAYHPHSGLFIAPVKGVYVFNVKMKVPPHHKLHLELLVDGKKVFDLGVEIPSSVDYESANELFIIEVNQGADVFVRADAHGGLLYGYMRSLFSGFLLFETE